MMKKVLITGASDGLGLGLAKLLVADGVEVVNISRSRPPIAIRHIQAQLHQEEDIAHVVEVVKQEHADFDALVHCVGAVHYHPIDGIDFAEISHSLQVNVAAVASLTSRLIPLIQHNDADVMIVSSTLGFKSLPEQAAYGAGVWGKRGLAHYFRSELKGSKSRVMSVCPGGMATRFHEKITGKPVDTTQYMPVDGVALCMKQLLELPKYVEVSEIVLNRKVASIG